MKTLVQVREIKKKSVIYTLFIARCYNTLKEEDLENMSILKISRSLYRLSNQDLRQSLQSPVYLLHLTGVECVNICGYGTKAVHSPQL